MSKRLLLADDSITIQKVVNLTFADEGVEVISVGDGDAAMKKFNESMPDLVLADVNMPGLDGYRMCEMIKQDDETKHIPVILLVGSFEPFDEQEAWRVGADDFLTKPFQSIRQLVTKVSDLLNTAPPNDEETKAEESRDRSIPLMTLATATTEFAADTGFPVETKDETKDESENKSENEAEDENAWQFADTKEFPAGTIEAAETTRGVDLGDTGMDDEMIQTNQIGEPPVYDEVQKFISQSYNYRDEAENEREQDNLTEKSFESAQPETTGDFSILEPTEQIGPEESETIYFGETSGGNFQSTNYSSDAFQTSAAKETHGIYDAVEIADEQPLPEPVEIGAETENSSTGWQFTADPESEEKNPENTLNGEENPDGAFAEEKNPENTFSYNSPYLYETENSADTTAELAEASDETDFESERRTEEFSYENPGESIDNNQTYAETAQENYTGIYAARTDGAENYGAANSAENRDAAAKDEEVSENAWEIAGEDRNEAANQIEDRDAYQSFGQTDEQTAEQTIDQTADQTTDENAPLDDRSSYAFASNAAANVPSRVAIDDFDLLELPPLVEETGIRPLSEKREVKSFADTGAATENQPAEADETASSEESGANDAAPTSAAAAAFPPELIEAIAQKVAERISDKAIREIAWEVVPQMTELIVQKLAEENLEGKNK